jgi:G8 domain
VLRFNYTAARESFVVGRYFNKSLTTVYTNVGMPPDANSCSNGDWWNDKTNKHFYICFSGKNKLPYEYVDVNPVRCEGSTCADGLYDVPKEPFQRLWSNASQWPLGVKPLAGHKVTIPGGWDLLLDESTPVFEELVINGWVTFDPTKSDLQLQSKRIWVKGGKIIIGSPTSPYPGKASIILHGGKSDEVLLMD